MRRLKKQKRFQRRPRIRRSPNPFVKILKRLILNLFFTKNAVFNIRSGRGDHVKNMAMKTFNDELDEVTPAAKAHVAAATPAPTQSPKPQPAAAAAATAAVEEEDDIPTPAGGDGEDLATDFEDEKIYYRHGQLDQCRPEKKGEAVRFSFVPKDWIALQSSKGHFVETPGDDGKVHKLRVRCLTPMTKDADWQFCCKALDKDGEVGVVALVVQYTNVSPETGKYAKLPDGTYPPVQFKIAFVRLSQFNMTQIRKLPDEDSDPFKIDIVMGHSGRAYGYEFTRASNVPRWTLDPEVAAQVKQAAQKFLDGKALIGKLGVKKNEVEWKAFLSGKKIGNESKIENVEEL